MPIQLFFLSRCQWKVCFKNSPKIKNGPKRPKRSSKRHHFVSPHIFFVSHVFFVPISCFLLLLHMPPCVWWSMTTVRSWTPCECTVVLWWRGVSSSTKLCLGSTWKLCRSSSALKMPKREKTERNFRVPFFFLKKKLKEKSWDIFIYKKHLWIPGNFLLSARSALGAT